MNELDKLIEKLRNEFQELNLRTGEKSTDWESIADFIIADRKYVASPLTQLELNYIGGPKAHTPAEFIQVIREVLKRAGLTDEKE